jgi:anti-sigma regulatory factor (Ser/Thr protein kinase)
VAIDSVRRSFAPDLEAPGAARRALDGFRGQLEEDVIERSALVLTEVVTNSVAHAGLTAAQPIDLNIQELPGCLRIEVTDEGTASFDPVVALPYPGQSSGRGFWMVDQLTDRWGVDFTRSTRVWCEFDLDPLSPARSSHTTEAPSERAWSASPLMAECRASAFALAVWMGVVMSGLVVRLRPAAS